MQGGDGGIYVGSIMKGGAVAQDGRIEPGDMILQGKKVVLYDRGIWKREYSEVRML